MGTTRFSGPVLGSTDSSGGTFENFPVGLVSNVNADVYFNDFLAGTSYITAGSPLDLTNDWVATDIGTVTAVCSITNDTGNSLLLMNTDAADNEGHVLQYANEFLWPIAGRSIAFEALVGVADANDMDVYIGVGETLTTFMGGDGTISGSAVNYAGFHILQSEGTGIASCVAKGGSGSAVDAGNASSATVGDATYTTGTLTNYHRYGVRINGTSHVEFFFDGSKVQETVLDTAFDDATTITLCSVGSGATSDITSVDYVIAGQTRNA